MNNSLKENHLNNLDKYGFILHLIRSVDHYHRYLKPYISKCKSIWDTSNIALPICTRLRMRILFNFGGSCWACLYIYFRWKQLKWWNRWTSIIDVVLVSLPLSGLTLEQSRHTTWLVGANAHFVFDDNTELDCDFLDFDFFIVSVSFGKWEAEIWSYRVILGRKHASKVCRAQSEISEKCQKSRSEY